MFIISYGQMENRGKLKSFFSFPVFIFVSNSDCYRSRYESGVEASIDYSIFYPFG